MEKRTKSLPGLRPPRHLARDLLPNRVYEDRESATNAGNGVDGGIENHLRADVTSVQGGIASWCRCPPSLCSVVSLGCPVGLHERVELLGSLA